MFTTLQTAYIKFLQFHKTMRTAKRIFIKFETGQFVDTFQFLTKSDKVNITLYEEKCVHPHAPEAQPKEQLSG
jgi:hypothetical protein